jgi:hypothetical protein
MPSATANPTPKRIWIMRRFRFTVAIVPSHPLNPQPSTLNPQPSTTRMSLDHSKLQNLLSFFNKFLKGEDDHLLDGPSSAYPKSSNS